jgi:hypothetical protein
MYRSYESFVKTQLINDSELNFKSNSEYNAILEHVSHEQGNNYIKFIKEKFPNVTYEQVNNYLLINDKYGNPKKEIFVFEDNEIFNCSPTSLRYVLHSLIILDNLKKTNVNKIVEVGCGYGGLFLGINYFSKLLNIEIQHYYIIDLPEICDLIEKYININRNEVYINYSIHSAYNYGNDINDTNMYFISNYCFTEIDIVNRNNYIKSLFPKVSNGFIVWQTVFNLSIDYVSIINKENIIVKEEYPQTACETYKNYYVFF